MSVVYFFQCRMCKATRLTSARPVHNSPEKCHRCRCYMSKIWDEEVPAKVLALVINDPQPETMNGLRRG